MSDVKLALVPTTKELVEGGKLTGGSILGIIAGHVAVKSLSAIDKPIGHGAMLLGGFYGACKVKNPLLQSLCVGVAVYGGLRLVGSAIAAVAAPGAETTQGLAGMIAGALPEGLKETLRKYVPTLSGIDDAVAGNDDQNLSLDDQGMQQDNGGNTSGMGNALGASVPLRLAA